MHHSPQTRLFDCEFVPTRPKRFRFSMRVGNGRRPYATTFSPSMPHILFFSCFPAAWATFVRSSLQQHLSLPAVITFLNDKFRVLLQFLKIRPHYAKDDNLKNFRSLFKINELCVQFVNCFTFIKKILHNFTHALWALRQIVWGSLNKKKRLEKSQY